MQTGMLQCIACDMYLTAHMHLRSAACQQHTCVSSVIPYLSYFPCLDELNCAFCTANPPAGVTLWEMVTCQQAFQGKTVPQILFCKTLGNVDSQLLYPPHAPRALASLASMCVRNSPTERPTAEQVSGFQNQ